MHAGLFLFPTDECPDPAELGRIAEGNGFESLFFPEHTHIPASRESPWPGGAELPREYTRSHDLFVALTAAACATTTLRVGAGICLVPQHDPIVTAKTVATLDHISGGRLIFGVGAGWNREEVTNHGVEPRERFAVMRERVQAMQALWTQDEASFHGDHVEFDRVWSWPKPLQQPYPELLLGGHGPTVIDRTLEYADGWIPTATNDDDALLERVAELRARAAEQGRRASVTILAVGTQPERLERYAQAEIDRVLFYLPTVDDAATRARAEKIAAIRRDVLGS
ncbi:unannotated protein [freshwater metagenome]|uniref:Unannotated protein n=1 Tax=freshwater metagenome TaxID=449393 RepID=A0A6J7J675_9ZZZZ|nr:TIGR03619 family F420-dependent LLM class oxidoreductase [Actinomycetota bacterium]